MRVQETYPIGKDKSVTVTELTVAEIRGLVVQFAARDDVADLDPAERADLLIDKTLVPGIDLSAIRLMTGLSREVLGAFGQSELQAIVEHCRGLNPLFFGMLARLEEAKQRAEMAALASFQWPSS
ncbi:hypothetical protein [Pseudogulbenkiania sp. NH8B]|uniref:hypothetical protein n=1 Tax=Pseudogulbenkiania sp. (strain NH8B) TaxID=748280 RepID=UPI0002F1C66D|nr:hypothetical protein [Pseudogulbenkiania sp. NH8B]